jgi:hypothetical protein
VDDVRAQVLPYDRAASLAAAQLEAERLRTPPGLEAVQPRHGKTIHLAVTTAAPTTLHSGRVVADVLCGAPLTSRKPADAQVTCRECTVVLVRYWPRGRA